MHVPRVSVIIPTYKRRDFILLTLESVFAQTYTDCEVIVVNDGSPDDTRAILQPLVSAGRIRYIEQKNSGQAFARNVGLSHARGEYIAYLDDDDAWPIDKLVWQVEELDNNPPAVMVYGRAGQLGTDRFLDGGRLPDGDVWKAFLWRNYIVSPGQTLIRKQSLEMIGGFDSDIWGAEDWDLYIRLARIGPCRFIPRLAIRYRQHAGSASRRVALMSRNLHRVKRKHLVALPPIERLHYHRKSNIFWGCVNASAFHRAKDLPGTYTEAMRALLSIPYDRKTFKETLHWLLPYPLRRGLRRLGMW